MTSYTTIFMEPDWAHVKYYGWKDYWPDPNIRVLSKMASLVHRILVLVQTDDTDRAYECVKRIRQNAGAIADVSVHDLTGAAAWANWGFQPVPPDHCLLNVDTFVIDLSREEDALLASMSSSCRRHIRRAEKRGFLAKAESCPSAGRVDEFLAQYGLMATERGLRIPDRAVLEQMFADGRACLYSVETPSTTHYLITYQASRSAIFLYGVARQKKNDGAGQLLQWTVIQDLKRRGISWYDMGGVPSLDDSDGLYRFKKGFGGELVALGREYVVRTPVAQAVFACRDLLQALKQTIAS